MASPIPPHREHGGDISGKKSEETKPTPIIKEKPIEKLEGKRKKTPMWAVRLRQARLTRPFTMVFSYLLPIPAVIVIIVGDNASAALTHLGAGTYGRVLGILLLIGCFTIILSVARNKSLSEAFGMTIVAIGCFMYGIGVIIGLLPFQGIIAGIGYIGIGVGFILSMFSLTNMARIGHQLDLAAEAHRLSE